MIRWLIWGVFTVSWTTLLLLPGTAYQTTGMDLWPTTVHSLVTKSAHLLAYALFAFLSGLLRLPARYRWTVLFFMMAHGAITETIQQHIGRNGCLEDVDLNYVGILLGIVVGWKWWTDPR